LSKYVQQVKLSRCELGHARAPRHLFWGPGRALAQSQFPNYNLLFRGVKELAKLCPHTVNEN